MGKTIACTLIVLLLAACIQINLDRRELITFNRGLNSAFPDPTPLRNLFYATQNNKEYLLGGSAVEGDMMVLSTDELGDLQSTFSILSAGIAQSIIPLQEEQFWLVAGYDARNPLLVWLNAQGEAERIDSSLFADFEEQVGAVKYVRFHDIVQAPDSSLFVCGSLRQSLGGDWVLLSHLDPAGNLLWQQRYEYRAAAYDLMLYDENTILMAGLVNNGQVILYNVDSNGKFKWREALPNAYSTRAPNISLTKEGEIAIAATRMVQGQEDIVCFIYDAASGDVLDSREIGSPFLNEKGQFVTTTRDSALIVVGGVDGGTDAERYAAFKYRAPSLSTEWERYYQGSEKANTAVFSCRQVSSDKGFIIAGIESSENGESQFRLIKTDEEGAVE
ncbi:MAG: hypothetical protein ACE362_02990 [Phaeodactylibacter xiamenensis]|uniref:Uncharacterized protein n=1 Tax=Phaeodactylibacter xiamenensis TaxID=1524460 RepID=A0A098S193_9BACT|nr:hypothetical protein [Phaeodactylibacter xiamenensis]KGE85816.1 hypothetical protein IX84_24590 [Phaeodactylibacter xiamenensis]MCR9051190.1 hypothetical protein [bacterium]